MPPAFYPFGQVICLPVHPAKEKDLELWLPQDPSPHQLPTAGLSIVELVVRRPGF